MFTIRLAGHLFAIDNRYEYVHALCRDYIVNLPAQTVIRAEDKDIESERVRVRSGQEGYLEGLAVYRQICEHLLPHEILLFHSSAIEIDGRAYLFAAPSGTGKSTHARLWRERFGERVTMINDDKPLLEFADNTVYVHATPYAGKHNLHTNKSAPVGAVVLLSRADENTIERIGSREAFAPLLAQSYRPKNEDAMRLTLGLVERLARLPVFRLGCTISGEAVELVYRTLKGID